MTRITAAVVMVMVVIGPTACSAPANTLAVPTPLSPNLPMTTSAPAIVNSTGLIPSEHPECDNVGTKVLHYLQTGDNGGDPHLDSALAYAVGSSVPIARSYADREILKCNNYYQAVASSLASQASESASKAAEADQEIKSCSVVGGNVRTDRPGSWSGGNGCYSTVQGSSGAPYEANCPDVYLVFDLSGHLDQSSNESTLQGYPRCFPSVSNSGK